MKKISLPGMGKTYEVKNGKIWASMIGTGKPAVIFLSGAGTVGLDYYEIQQRVSKDALALIYDRLGTGWSSVCNLPRTSKQVVEELHDLLAVSGVPGPSILVGHSLGGLYARHYATIYPEDVLGLVLLDPAHEDYDRFMPEELNRLRKLPTEEEKRKLVNRKPKNSPGFLVRMARNDLGRAVLERIPMVTKYQKVYTQLFSDELSKWPEEIRNQLVSAHSSVQWLLSGSREALNFYAVYEEVRNARPIPDIPTTILTSMEIDGFRRVVLMGETDELIAKEINGKSKLYENYLSSIKEGKLIEVKSGHVNMPFRHPDTVVSAILEMLSRLR